MPEIDFGNIYCPNGKIIQHRYAQKAADAGPTIIGMKSSKGAVLIASKPVVSRLHVIEHDHRIKRIASNAYMTYTGILTDGVLIHEVCKASARDYTANFDSEITTEYLRRIIHEYTYMFTAGLGSRVVGATLFTIVRDGEEYSLLHTDCLGKVTKWNGCAAGKGERRAFTELEKLQLEDMGIEEMVEQGIRILYKCHDPLTEPEFRVEAGYLGHESGGEFVRMNDVDVAEICERFKDLTVDEEY